MSKIALGTWAWGAGAFGGDAVFAPFCLLIEILLVISCCRRNVCQ